MRQCSSPHSQQHPHHPAADRDCCASPDNCVTPPANRSIQFTPSQPRNLSFNPVQSVLGVVCDAPTLVNSQTLRCTGVDSLLTRALIPSTSSTSILLALLEEDIRGSTQGLHCCTPYSFAHAYAVVKGFLELAIQPLLAIPSAGLYHGPPGLN